MRSSLPRALLVVLAGLLAGCEGDVVMKDPRTGQTVTCAQSLYGFDPWSQTYACVSAHAAQGWRRVGEP